MNTDRLCSTGASITFTELIDRLHEVFASDKVDVDYVKELMTSYKSDRSDWKDFAQFDQYRCVLYE